MIGAIPALCSLLVQVECEVGKPRVNFREAITKKATFDYLHKKQSGGSGQYAKAIDPREQLCIPSVPMSLL